MDKAAYTPQKQPKSAVRQTAHQTYSRNTPQSLPRPSLTPASELAILKDYESLKIQVRQLQAKNRTLTSEVEQLLYQKSYNENKFLQKMNFEEQAIAQFHKQKNYQLQLLQIKHEQQHSKLKRQAELRTDQYLRQIKHRDYQIKQKDQQNRYLQLRNQELRRDYEVINAQFAKCRQQNSLQVQKITHNQFTIKKYQMLLEQLQLQKAQMESQIRTLLDIEAQKTLTLNTLEIQLRNSQDNERRLMDKLTVLSENFAQLQDHITVMKQKLLNADQNNHLLNQKLDRAQLDNRDKQRLLLQQNQRQNQLRIQLEQYQRRQTRRQRQVAQLMNENQRLYKQLNMTRHRLHEFGIAYNVDI